MLTVLSLHVWLGTPNIHPISREQFIGAYVSCNNRAWAGASHELIPFVRDTRARLDAGTESPAVLGFIQLGYLWGQRKLDQAHTPATLGWAAAMKAYADAGGIERQFRVASAARTYLRSEVRQDMRELDDREFGALATSLHLARLAGRTHLWSLDGLTRESLAAPLDAAKASKLLRTIGSHESVGSAKVGPLVVRPCSERDARQFLKQKS